MYQDSMGSMSSPKPKQHGMRLIIIIAASVIMLAAASGIVYWYLSQTKEYSYIPEIEAQVKDFTAADEATIGPFKALVGDITRNAVPVDDANTNTTLRSQQQDVVTPGGIVSGSQYVSEEEAAAQQEAFNNGIEYIMLTMVYAYDDQALSGEAAALSAWPEGLFANIKLNGASPTKMESDFVGGDFSEVAPLTQRDGGLSVTYLFPVSLETIDNLAVTYDFNIVTGQSTVGNNQESNNFRYTIGF